MKYTLNTRILNPLAIKLEKIYHFPCFNTDENQLNLCISFFSTNYFEIT